MADSILKRMAGKAVPHGVWSHPFGEPQILGIFFDKLFHRSACSWLISYCAGKQPSLWTVITIPVLGKDFQIFITKYCIAVLSVF